MKNDGFLIKIDKISKKLTKTESLKKLFFIIFVQVYKNKTFYKNNWKFYIKYSKMITINLIKLFYKGDMEMNKQELVAAMAAKANLSKKDAEAALVAFVGSVEDALKKGEKVQLVGFGSFEVRERAARTGRNPQTGAEMKIAAAKVPTFKAGSSLKELINK